MACTNHGSGPPRLVPQQCKYSTPAPPPHTHTHTHRGPPPLTLYPNNAKACTVAAACQPVILGQASSAAAEARPSQAGPGSRPRWARPSSSLDRQSGLMQSSWGGGWREARGEE